MSPTIASFDYSMAASKEYILPTHEDRLKQRNSEKELMDMEYCKICNDSNANYRVAFLAAYFLTSAVATTYITYLDTPKGTLSNLTDIAMNLVGVWGVLSLQPTALFIASMYIACSFIFTSVGAALFSFLIILEDPRLPSIMNFSPSMNTWIEESPLIFKFSSMLAMFVVLFFMIEVFVQVRKLHKYASHRQGKAAQYCLIAPVEQPFVTKYQFGSIAIGKPY